tara:strand:+ start:68643 stop:69086 length:444 start_codon:yes stop_codon:yes gene_type:complete
MKSEPDVFSIDHLKKDKTTLWEGVRNYQARNFMMNDMKEGDEVLFYHSSCEPPGIAGLAVITKEKQPDPSQFDKKSKYFDSKATKEKPIWYCVEVGFEKKFNEIITLEKLKSTKELSELLVLKRGQRLSIQPVTKTDFEWIKKNLVK